MPGAQGTQLCSTSTRWSVAQSRASHAVSAADALWPVALVIPGAQGTQAPFETRSSRPQRRWQRVSGPDASCPAAATSFGAQRLQRCATTWNPAAQRSASHCVSSPDASSPPALVFPGGQARHVLPATCSRSAHEIASHCVSLPDAMSPAALVVPGAQGRHILLATYSFAPQRAGPHAVSRSAWQCTAFTVCPVAACVTAQSLHGWQVASASAPLHCCGPQGGSQGKMHSAALWGAPVS